MGADFCSSRSIKPPNDRLIGTWILNQESKSFSVHQDPIRESYDNSKLRKNIRYKKLVIRSNGHINYSQYTDGFGFCVQGPVVKWKDQSIQTFNGSIVRIDFRKLADDEIIVESDYFYRLN